MSTEDAVGDLSQRVEPKSSKEVSIRDSDEPAPANEAQRQAPENVAGEDADATTDPDADTPVLSDEDIALEARVREPIVREPVKRLAPPPNAKRLDPEYDVWIDPDERVVLVDGFVSFREGPLEMFACTKGTKEHESIVSANTSAIHVHVALLNIGAETGSPVQFVPEFKPPSGTEIEIRVIWEDENGDIQTARAQDWVRDARTQKAMSQPWVFAGSGFWDDPATGKSHYQAEAGDFICVSNFSSAMLDIPVESTQANEGLAFEAFTERIPPLGTHVRLVLKPKLAEEPATADDNGKDSAAGPGEDATTSDTTTTSDATTSGAAEP